MNKQQLIQSTKSVIANSNSSIEIAHAIHKQLNIPSAVTSKLIQLEDDGKSLYFIKVQAEGLVNLWSKKN